MAAASDSAGTRKWVFAGSLAKEPPCVCSGDQSKETSVTPSPAMAQWTNVHGAEG